MTNHWIDYKNADVFINLGGNTAENHPISMKWIEHARKNRGAKLIVVDPRVSRTAAVADLYAPQRPGTNIAFINGMINYILEKKLYHEEYVVNYTNSTYLVNENFGFDDVTGLFSGVEDDNNVQTNPGKKKYDVSSWQYQTDGDGNILKDPTMQDPKCVMQLMKKHYSRYTVKAVSEITGCPEDKFVEVCDLYGSTGQPGKAGNFMYAMGITQFTHGAQNVRDVAILQLMLGNVGIPGGGVNAQRGQSNVQGACDMGMLYHIVTGYMPVPRPAHVNLEGYNATTPASGWWSNRPKYMASMLKAFYGDKATASNDFLFDYLPKLKYGDHSHIAIYDLVRKGEIKGMICWADNPAVSGPHATTKRKYQANLDWYVAVDLVANESADFWKAPDIKPEDVKTEVFILPANSGYERDGTKTNSGRWVQWIYKAQDGPGECRTDLEIVNELFKAVRKEYENDSNATFPAPIVDMLWDYDDENGNIDVEKVCMEINGYNTADGSLVTNFTQLQDDGSTACGSWIYSGYYNNLSDPHCKRRIKEKEGVGSNSDFAWAWPVNRRIVYNRCSSDPAGKPWNPDIPLIWWENGEWKRNDVPDFGWFNAAEQVAIPPEVSAARPFIMLPEGQARLFSFGVNDGPFPTHYEPADSPVQNLLYPQATYNAISTRWYPTEEHTVVTDEERKAYPYIMTTYRVCEHYQTGALTRNTPWLNELMPELFIELDEKLAAALKIENGDTVEISSKRTGTEKAIKAKACVTQRLKPLMIQGEERHIVGMPYHWGYSGLAKGDICNDLSPSCGDPNTTIPEYKAFLCNIRKVG